MEEDAIILSGDKTFTYEIKSAAYKPQLIQKVVAIMLCVAPLISIFVLFYPLSIDTYDTESQYNYRYYGQFIWPSLENVIYALGFGLLIKQANNKATRIALILGVCYFVYVFFLATIINYLCYANDAIHFYDKDIDIPSYLVSIGDILGYSNVILVFIPVYCCGLILTNSDLSPKSKAWINLLVVLFVYYIFVSPLFNLIYNLSLKDIDWYWLYERKNHFFWTQIFHFFWLPVVNILLAAAYYHFARSEAFSGHYDANATCKYSPLNKWMAAAIIAPTVVALGIFILYKNYQLFI